MVQSKKLEVITSTRYEIDDNNAIRVYINDNTFPSLLQPNWPNGTLWKDRQEAENWAILYIDSITNEEAPYAPNGPGETGLPKIKT